MDNICPLSELCIGGSGSVVSMDTAGVGRKRMLDLGLIRGTKVKALMMSPSGDPTAYCIRGSVIALRADDAEKILVQPI